MKMIKITTKDSGSPSITKEIEKPSKRKQPLYSKFKTETKKIWKRILRLQKVFLI